MGDDGSWTKGIPWSSPTRGTSIPANRAPIGPSIACSPSPIAKSPWSNTGVSARDSTQVNAFGLFDMLGNALEWSHESSPHHTGTPGRDVEDLGPVDGGVNRFLRGGAYIHRAEGVRSD